MGGLYSSKDIEDEERVPILSAIPFLGRFFRGFTTSQAQVQLVFLLKVTIVPDSTGMLLSNIDSTRREVKKVGQILERSIVQEARAGEEE